MQHERVQQRLRDALSVLVDACAADPAVLPDEQQASVDFWQRELGIDLASAAVS